MLNNTKLTATLYASRVRYLAPDRFCGSGLITMPNNAPL